MTFNRLTAALYQQRPVVQPDLQPSLSSTRLFDHLLVFQNVFRLLFYSSYSHISYQYAMYAYGIRANGKTIRWNNKSRTYE